MSIYNVPIIPLNLRKEETIVQIAESLNQLSEVANDLFARINSRLAENTKRLSAFDERLSKVNAKIASISKVKRAIRVFSSSKYPAADTNKPYKTVFTNTNVPEKVKFYAKYRDNPPKEEPVETLQFYHLNFPDTQKTSLEGLGKIPADIEGVNDLLLFNSGTNPYSKYVIADTLNVTKKAKKEAVNDGPEIAAPPLSISEPSVHHKPPGESFSYSPHLGDVPTIDVPIDLPDLPGIADDLRYTYSDHTIAPSVITSPNLPDLPEILEEVKETPTPPAVEAPKIVQEPSTSSPPIQPEEEPIEETPVQAEVITHSPKEPEVTKKPSGGDVHASLMEAIRNAGGMKTLKHTEREMPAKPKAPDGDLMADLHSKLMMRRKGISGSKRRSGIEPGSAMGKISAMLPPPSANSEQSESGTTDDDWDD